MAKTEKHVRTSGATTVTKDGKIIGNIGSGKTNVPTSSGRVSQSEEKNDSKINIQNVLRPDYDSVTTLWRLFPEDDNDAKIALLSTYAQQMTQEDLAKTVFMLNDYLADLSSLQKHRLLKTFASAKLDDKLTTTIMDCGGPFIQPVVTNPHTSLADINYFLDNYADHPNAWITVCHNRGLDSATVRKIFVALQDYSSNRNNSLSVRRGAKGGLRYVAEHPNTPGDVLEHLYDMKEYRLMDTVVCHANAPRRILDDAITNEDNHLKAQMATNVNLPEDLAYTLYDASTDKDLDIRYALAANPATPKKILARLALSEEDDIRTMAEYNLNL